MKVRLSVFPYCRFFCCFAWLALAKATAREQCRGCMATPAANQPFCDKKRKRVAETGARPKGRPTPMKASGAEQCETQLAKPSPPVAKAIGQGSGGKPPMAPTTMTPPPTRYRRVPPPPPPKPTHMPKPWWPPTPPIAKKARPQATPKPNTTQSQSWWRATGSRFCF